MFQDDFCLDEDAPNYDWFFLAAKPRVRKTRTRKMKRNLLAAAFAGLTLGLLCGAASAPTQSEAELRATITLKDRKIIQLAGEVERLTYVAGLASAKPGSAAVTGKVQKAQHAETIAAVGQANGELALLAESSDGIRAILAANVVADRIRGKAIADSEAAETLSHRLLVIVACLVVAVLGLQTLYMLGIWRHRAG